MTGEELEKEAEDKGVEYANNETPPKGEWIDAGYSYGQIVKAYERGALDFAEPREKRIEELEVKIKKLTQHLEPQLMTELLEQVREEVEQEQKLKELEKENAELKKVKQVKLEALEGQIPWKDIKDKSEVIGQLTKAKEIIEQLLSDNRIMKAQFESEEQANIWFEHIHQAEQFLKDSEVEK